MTSASICSLGAEVDNSSAVDEAKITTGRTAADWAIVAGGDEDVADAREAYLRSDDVSVR